MYFGHVVLIKVGTKERCKMGHKIMVTKERVEHSELKWLKYNGLLQC